MMLIAQTQGHTAYASQTLLRAAAGTGSIEPGQYRTRLAPALESAQASWVGLATMWAQLAPQRGRRLGPDLVMAANEIRAAMLEIIHDRSGVASTETLAATVDLKQVAQKLQLGLATSTDLAYALREATADPHLLASARGVNAIAMALEAHGPYGNVSTEAWVRPVDHAQDRPIALPDIVRDSLTRAADQVTQAVKTAAGAAAFVSAPEGIAAARTSARQSDSSAPCLPGSGDQRPTPSLVAINATPSVRGRPQGVVEPPSGRHTPGAYCACAPMSRARR
jgi:hypothetical protein